jgi:hypothetical protein
MPRFAIVVVLLVCASLPAQDSKNLILATRRTGAIEFIDPATLDTVGRIHFDLPQNSAGLNGISASADGSMIYVEAPKLDEPSACCVLYSIDLQTLQTKLVADYWGTRSRTGFVMSEGITYTAAELTATGELKDTRSARLQLSPNGRWLFGVVSFRGLVLNIYDLAQGNIIRQLSPTGLGLQPTEDGRGGDWYATGAWSGDRFYFYAANTDGSRIWTVTPESTELGEGVIVEPFGQLPGCSEGMGVELTAAGGNVFLYETFGWKMDRRQWCQGVPGGAWLIDPATGRLLRHVAPDLHFFELIPDRTEPVLYGLATEAPNGSGPTELVRIDARDGSVMASRLLDTDFWYIAIAPIRIAPPDDLRAIP